jgi:hypothetical protein
MNKIIFILCFISFACQTDKSKIEQNKFTIDSLSKQIEELKEKYRPGLGEIMGGIQMHHAKLWFAGINENWKLAEYEINEIKERFEEAVEIETNRKESKSIPMIFPFIDSLKNIIKENNLEKFKSAYKNLTNTCNECHKANNFGFNVITVPSQLPVSNQEFKVKNSK